MTVFVLAVDVFAIADIPTKLLSLGGVLNAPVYFHFKRKNLRRHVYDGTIPAWTAFWNKTYFGPKGLCVGFDLPGPVFKRASVEPKRRRWSVMRKVMGEYKKPMSKTRAARRARITVAVIGDAVPEAGRRPRIEPLKMSRIHCRASCCHSRFGELITNRRQC